MNQNLRDLLRFTAESWTTWSGIQVLSVMLTTKSAPPPNPLPALHRGVKYEIELWKIKVRAGPGLPYRSTLRERDGCKQLK